MNSIVDIKSDKNNYKFEVIYKVFLARIEITFTCLNMTAILLILSYSMYVITIDSQIILIMFKLVK